MEAHHTEIGVLKQNEISQLLMENHVGHLGCHTGNEIYVVPVLYVYEDGYIYSHTLHGKKLGILRNNPQVCLQVENIHGLFNWRSVIVWGEVEELYDDEAARATRMLNKKVNSLLGEGKNPTLQEDFDAMLEKSVLFRFKITKSSGRFEGKA